MCTTGTERGTFGSTEVGIVAVKERNFESTSVANMNKIDCKVISDDFDVGIDLGNLK